MESGKKMRIAVAGILHETNSFAPGTTGTDDFRDKEWASDREIFHNYYEHTRTSMGGVIHAVRDSGAELACGVYTAATPSGIVTAEAAEFMMDALVASLDPAADGIVLILHGAMVAEGYPDMEGEILRRVRSAVGPSKPIAMTLDLHANVSAEMVEYADVIVGYDTYPHVDMYERAVEAVGLLIRTIRKEINPVRALAHPRMLVVPQVMVTETEGPFRELMDLAFAIEQDARVLNVTVIGGFPYSDVPDAGIAFIVTTDGDRELAGNYAEALRAAAWERRERLVLNDIQPAKAVRLAFAEEEGPVILVEGSDNVGGGSPADATHVLKRLIHAPKKSLIVIRDEEAAALAHELGVGAQFAAPIGGKSDRLHGDPVFVSGKIRLLSDGKYTHMGAYMTGQRADMGLTAVVEAGHLTVVLTEKRTAPWDPGHVVSLGIRAETYHVIVVKAAIAWRTSFGSICKRIIPVDSPGCTGSSITDFAYEKVRRPIYPLDATV
ncbi:M81 family metallopeptidase [Paenibacillus spongiae]|uniref:M81 family metallopeptidase n=1 Tax=Paenibacillus spongiae TaxID=2909671 RepID=A0ABY5SBQ3_9BACL|nr:M81 family metallopeptidase [Paenibacillus spongiae]UVI31352.1 M81 family metallopeptidase [Paenibacillus spongiae]